MRECKNCNQYCDTVNECYLWIDFKINEKKDELNKNNDCIYYKQKKKKWFGAFILKFILALVFITIAILLLFYL